MKKNLSIIFACLSFCAMAQEKALPDASWDKLPRWRGFNLIDKLHLDWANGQFQEEDFKLISEFGFNFVRLPMDYRIWIVDGDWNKFDEKALKGIDQAVGWGGKYGIHVSINFHRAPGFSIAKPAESLSLWEDADALEACILHWAMFAKRYKGIPNSRLSFNLFNEPAGVTEGDYFKVVKAVCDAIRKEDPERLIISDGISAGSRPCSSLKELKVAQATRGYIPFEVTHYKAEWAYGSDKMQLPSWPKTKLTGILFGPEKEELQAPFIIKNTMPFKLKLRLRMDMVSDKSNLIVKADDKIVLSREFVNGPGKGEWKEAVYKPEYEKYQNVYDLEVFAEIPAGTKKISLENSVGDWMSIAELGVMAGGMEFNMKMEQIWGRNPVLLDFTSSGFKLVNKEEVLDRKWLWTQGVDPWKKLESEGVGVMIGEFGAYNKTPHDVVLAWMEDCLLNWKEAGWGWALWNFRGSFGILDSGRKDVKYEDFNGHKLDRKMLEMLQKY
ncbi:MAG: hypothetical protein A2X48_19460 [Lentisphaerae bacterium GWF2_49_21]|nr:MAG: hypothetical protein A2X48_19460 [Lentisphaerae bacterium GWF2_49_21]